MNSMGENSNPLEQDTMAERSRRPRAKPLLEVEEEEGVLYDLFLTYLHEDSTDYRIDQLRTLLGNLKGAYEAASAILSDLMLKYEGMGSVLQAKNTSDKWKRVRHQFKMRYSQLREN